MVSDHDRLECVAPSPDSVTGLPCRGAKAHIREPPALLVLGA